MFVDAGGAGVRLQAGSPCIDTGTMTGNVAVKLGMADKWLAQPLASAGMVNVNVASGLTAGSDYQIKVLWTTNNAIAASSGAISIAP